MRTRLFNVLLRVRINSKLFDILVTFQYGPFKGVCNLYTDATYTPANNRWRCKRCGKAHWYGAKLAVAPHLGTEGCPELRPLQWPSRSSPLPPVASAGTQHGSVPDACAVAGSVR